VLSWRTIIKIDYGSFVGWCPSLLTNLCSAFRNTGVVPRRWPRSTLWATRGPHGQWLEQESTHSETQPGHHTYQPLTSGSGCESHVPRHHICTSRGMAEVHKRVSMCRLVRIRFAERRVCLCKHWNFSMRWLNEGKYCEQGESNISAILTTWAVMMDGELGEADASGHSMEIPMMLGRDMETRRKHRPHQRLITDSILGHLSF